MQFTIDPRIDKMYLFTLLMREYRHMMCYEEDFDQFTWQVDAFFFKHAETIKRLLDSVDMTFDPLQNHGMKTVRDFDRTQNIQEKGTSDTTGTMKGTKTNTQQTLTDKNDVKDTTEDTTGNVKEVGSENSTQDSTDSKSKSTEATRDITDSTQRSSSGEETTSETSHETDSKTDSETGSEDKTRTHYVSAFNQTSGNDVEDERETNHTGSSSTINSNGTSDRTGSGSKNTTDSGTESSTKNDVFDESVSESGSGKITVGASDTRNSDSTNKVVGKITDKTDIEENVTSNGTENRNTTENVSTSGTEDLGENVDETTVVVGMKDSSYQALLAEYRKVVQFNVYDWIVNRFGLELMVCVW